MTGLDQVLIIDDHPLFRGALASALKQAFPDSVSHEVGTLGGAVEILESDGLFDVVMLALNMAGINGFEGLMRLRTQFPRQPVLVFAGSENGRMVDEAIACGAAGFLPKLPGHEILSTAICTILKGDIYIPVPRLSITDDI